MTSFTFMLRALAQAVQTLADGGGPFWAQTAIPATENPDPSAASKSPAPPRPAVPKPR